MHAKERGISRGPAGSRIPALRPFKDDGRGGVGLPHRGGGPCVRFLQRLAPLDLHQVFPEDAPQFHGGGRVILHAVPGRDDFFTGAPVQMGGAVLDHAVGGVGRMPCLISPFKIYLFYYLLTFIKLLYYTPNLC